MINSWVLQKNCAKSTTAYSNQTLWLSLLVKICLDKTLLGWITKQEINGKTGQFVPLTRKKSVEVSFWKNLIYPGAQEKTSGISDLVILINLPETITASLQLKFLDAWKTFPFGAFWVAQFSRVNWLAGYLVSGFGAPHPRFIITGVTR